MVEVDDDSRFTALLSALAGLRDKQENMRRRIQDIQSDCDLVSDELWVEFDRLVAYVGRLRGRIERLEEKIK